MNEINSSVTSQTASWFEFLLNPTLLDTFLTADNLEIAGTDLIIQFLISANLIEQKAKLKPPNENPIGLKDNRIRALRHLAMKITAKLNWDLVIIERRIPVAVVSDLIHCFVRLTSQSDRNYRDREQLQQLSKLEEPVLFAIQLLHRWTIRTAVQAAFPNKPMRIFQVNVAGYVNPLQHMREPNENAIQIARAKARESVQALENLLEWISAIRIPVDACFDLIDSERQLVNCDWSRQESYPVIECRARIAYDLGMFYFYDQNYHGAHAMFRLVNDVRDQLESSNYFSGLDGYLSSLQTLETNFLIKSKDRFLLGLPTARTSIEEYINFLAEDNETKQMSLTARLRLEDRLEIGSQSHKFVCSFNLVRCLLDGKHLANPHFAFDYLETALQRIKSITLKQQVTLNNFLKIHFHNLSKTLQEQLRSNQLSHLVGEKFVLVHQQKRVASLRHRSYLLERANTTFKNQTRLLYSHEPEILTKTIQEMDTNELRPMLNELFPPPMNPTPIEQSLNLLVNSNPLLGQFLRILYEKAKRAKSLENFTQGRRFLSCAIEILNPLNHQDLNIGQLLKYFHYERLLYDLNEVLSRQAFLDHDNHLWETCQSFLTENHSDDDVNLELTCLALAYAISREKIPFVQSLLPTVRRIRPCLDLAKLFARILNNANPAQIRPELAREFWERICEILSENALFHHQSNRQGRSRSTPSNNLNERLSLIDFEEFLFHLTHPLLIQMSFSLLSRLYSLVLVDQCHVEIFSEFGRCWPTSIDYRQRTIRSSVVTQLIEHFFQHIERLEFLPNPIKASLYRTQADIYLASQQYSAAMQTYLISISIDTNQLTASNLGQQDDLIIRNMIKAALQLGYHLQVACISQLLVAPDYNIIFKTLQENYINDDIDDYYECIWDLALLESFIHNCHHRGYEDKKRLAIRICKQKDLNGNNSDEIRFRAIRLRKRLLYKQLVAHYLLPSTRLYRLRTINKSCHPTISFE